MREIIINRVKIYNGNGQTAVIVGYDGNKRIEINNCHLTIHPMFSNNKTEAYYGNIVTDKGEIAAHVYPYDDDCWIVKYSS